MRRVGFRRCCWRLTPAAPAEGGPFSHAHMGGRCGSTCPAQTWLVDTGGTGERGWHDAKYSLGLRPVYHDREDRISSHIQLCWLALVLIRLAETRTGDHLAHPAPRTRPHATGPPSPPLTAASPNARPPPAARRPSWPRSTSPNQPNTSTSPPPSTAHRATEPHLRAPAV